MAKKSKEMQNAFVIPRRAVWYVLRTLIIIMIVVSMTFFIFLTMMHYTNIYIIVTEGMTIRAKCILGESDPIEMEQYFTESCIKADKAFEENVYEHYNIKKHDYRLTVNKLSVLPWNKTATVKVTERVPSITGTAYEDAPSSSIPEWESVIYNIVVLNENNRWSITKIEVSDEKPAEIPRATPNMSMTPIPAPTSTPTIAPTEPSLSSDAVATPKNKD